MLKVGGCIFDQRHFVYDTLDGVYPFPITCGIFKNAQIWLLRVDENLNTNYMIAQINIQTRECRCFDIRKLSPRECLTLMGVPKEYIDRMMQKEVRTYKAIDGCEEELALLGLDDAATAREIREAAEELLNKQNEEDESDSTNKDFADMEFDGKFKKEKSEQKETLQSDGNCADDMQLRRGRQSDATNTDTNLLNQSNDEDESNRVGEEQRTSRQGAEIPNQECGELPDILLRRQRLQGQGNGDGEHVAVLADRILSGPLTLEVTGGPHGDETFDYIVTHSTAKTAGEFVQEVLRERADEWGEFIFGDNYSGFKYRHGVLLNPLPDEVANEKIVSIKSKGGWSAMDYTIYTTDYYQEQEEEAKSEREKNAVIEQARDRLLAAPRVERTAMVLRISNSSLYKLAGNSIVCDVLMMIYEQAFFPTGNRLPGEQPSLFDLPQFSLQRNWQEKPCKLLTLCSGYDSQAIAMEMLKEKHQDFDYRLVAWAEYDPESSRPIDEQPAVVAHNLNFPTRQGRNLGDMTKIDWPKWMHDNDAYPGDIDLLTYSTPCTDISQAGKRAGIAKGSGTRSSILWSTEDAIAHLKPKMALQENVRALINKENMPHFREWCRVLESHGYVNFLPPSFPKADGTTTIAGVLNARDYGVPQNRDRVFMLSIRKDVLGDTQYEFPRPFPLTKTIADILEDDAPSSLFLKPQSVEAFLRKNEDNQEYIYAVTDHKPTAEEVERMIEKAGK